ncbi:MAG: hypothetical protein ACYC7E_01445 [Armatimonadota bacterium]
MPNRLLVPLLLLVIGLSLSARTATKVAWEGEIEQIVNAGNMRFGAAMVDDPQASGGKVLRIPYQKGTSSYSVQMYTPAVTLQGRCQFVFTMRGEGMLPISDPVSIYVIAHDNKTGNWAHNHQYNVYGINLKPTGYTSIPLVLDTALTPTGYRGCASLFTWQVRTENIAPALYVDRVEIRTEIVDSPRITEVFPLKVRCSPRDTAGVKVTIANPTERDVALTMVGEELSGLTTRRKVFTQPITLKAGETKESTAEWKLGPEEYGREIAVSLLEADKVVDTASGLFTVSKTPLWLSAQNGTDTGATDPRNQGLGYSFYVEPTTAQDSWRSIKMFKRLSPGMENFEFFSWSGGDIADLAPREDPFPSNEGRMAVRSKLLIQQQNKMFTSVGMWPVTYVNGTVWADAGYQLFVKHPEWFQYDSNGEVANYSMKDREIFRHKDDVDFDVNTYGHIHFQGTLNHALPAVQEYMARQFIASAREMGFKGLRFDVCNMGIGPGTRDFYGKEIVTTAAEGDKATAAALRRMKELVRKEIPDFTFGYNYCSPEENDETPLTLKEKAEGGGWMLDELSCVYQEKSSPFHFWAAFGPRMVSWGNTINKLGGIYNPFDFRRGGPNFNVDRIYSSIFRLIAGGRSPFCASYFNSRLPSGDYARFATRYSEFFFGRDRELIPKIKDEVTVKAAADVWWKEYAYWNRDSAGRRQLQVNLINPPKSPEVEENPRSELLPPVRNIEVTAAPVGGKAPTAAYLLSAEPAEPYEEAKVTLTPLTLTPQAGGGASVTVPSVIFWKMVVFQY